MNAIAARRTVGRWGLGSALYVLLATPPMRSVLESGMVTHQCLQIPALALCGWLWGSALPASARGHPQWADPAGISGAICLIFASLYWMLPRALDAAVDEPLFTVAKFVTVPVCIGLALACSWHRLHPIVRGVIKIEGFVMLLRLAWLYTDAPQRLCSNYLLGEQRDLAHVLIAVACVWGVYEVGCIFFGRPGTRTQTKPCAVEREDRMHRLVSEVSR